MMFTLLLGTALAADSGVQVAAFKPGLEFASEMISGMSYDVEQANVSAELACYDEVGINDLNVHIPIDTFELDFGNDSLVADIHFGQIHGEDMLIYADDSDTFDACISLEADFRSFAIDHARVLIDLRPTLVDDRIVLEFIGDVTVTGDISTDIEWVPDSLILNFVEERIFETIEELIAERVPALVGDAIDTSLFAGEVGDFLLDVTLTEVSPKSDAIEVGMAVEANWLGDGCSMGIGNQQPSGRSPDISFGDGDGAGIGLGITELQLNTLFFGAWADGLLCFEAGPLALVTASIESLMSEQIDDPDVTLSFDAAPQVVLDSDGIGINLTDMIMRVVGDIDGEATELLSLEADIAATLELKVDHSTSLLVLNIVDADLSLEQFHADPLISDADGAEQRLVEFIEEWVMDTLAQRIADVPIFANLFHIQDIFVRIEDIHTDPGSLKIMGSLFSGDDPEVDTEAPDTLAHIAKTTPKRVYVQWEAKDDSQGPFAYSYRFDSGSWSDWTSDERIVTTAPPPGEHVIEVRSRDSWLNTDPTPAMLLFVIDPPNNDKKGCGCATSSTRSSFSWLLLFLGIVPWLRRR